LCFFTLQIKQLAINRDWMHHLSFVVGENTIIKLRMNYGELLAKERCDDSTSWIKRANDFA
jgi:hypothetical protein